MRSTTAKIRLARGGHFLIDKRDLKRVEQFNWSIGSHGYVQARVRYRHDGRVQLRCVLLHRLIVGAQPTEIVDHKNHDKRDCRRSNLRLCTAEQNNAGMRPRPGTSRYKGVSWVAARGLWETRLGVGGKKRFLGYHATERDAALAYDEAAKTYHGEFAYLNLE